MLNALTSFRFIAAFMVFIFHLGLFNQYQLGAAGVSFFFVLSGFILAYNYHNHFINIDRVRLKKFYIARFAKIYPVHALTFLMAVPLVILYFKPDGLYFVKFVFMSIINLSLLQSFVPNQGTYFNFNSVSWTLSVEMFFYLTFPFLLWIFKKLKVSIKVSNSLIILILIWTVFFIFNLKLDENNHFFIWLLHICPIARLFEFVSGLILGLIFIEKSEGESSKKIRFFTILELLSLTTFFVLLQLSTQLSIGAVRGGFFIPVWCLLIFVFAYQRGFPSKLLSNKYLVHLGEISFSFYMIHQLVIRYLDFYHFGDITRLLISFLVTLLLSKLVYHFYEEPLRKRIRFGNKKIVRIKQDTSA